MIVAIVAIILIIISGITAKQRENITVVEKWIGNLITPVQSVINTGVSSLGENISSIARLTKLKTENEELKKEVEALEKEVLNLSMAKSELEELKGLKYALNYIEDTEKYNTITASIVGKSPGNWFNIFTIDVGENQGIKKDSIVLDSNGLVGRVYEVGGTWSKVISIIDNNSSVSFQIMRDSSLQGIVTGSITNEVTGYLFDPLADVIVGDKIVTSGLGIYPKGITIGEIVEIDKSGDHLLKTIKVEPSVNFKRITKVLVMGPRQIDY
ncbi:rod shape-determining protein MreC [Alkaliphilus sp. MSJ-5]|uniref:Cell shape-determining protein MreC n=2 Tax=Alkaliphilus flagellatus TaxID=2841507 RepID=A0ABS6G7J7_9FIRM|nr:rod shape-determining protein MreC [Alkaliphilus flagellatus]MBU5677702.1 rod shape-determining protein MreC [Alkaliphilus flagellatus]